MNEELKGRLVKWLDTVEGSVAEAVDFSKEQVPQVIEELISYTIVANAVYIVVWLIPVVVTIMAVLHFRQLLKTRPEVLDDECPPVSLFVAVIAGVLSLLTCIIPLRCVDELLKAWLAPRVFILEYIADLV